MRIKETVTKDKMSWYLDKFSLLVPYEMYGEQSGEYAFSYEGLKGHSRVGFLFEIAG